MITKLIVIGLAALSIVLVAVILWLACLISDFVQYCNEEKTGLEEGQ